MDVDVDVDMDVDMDVDRGPWTVDRGSVGP